MVRLRLISHACAASAVWVIVSAYRVALAHSRYSGRVTLAQKLVIAFIDEPRVLVHIVFFEVVATSKLMKRPNFRS